MLITPPSSYLVDVPSDAPELVAARMAEPAFAAAVSARDAGPDTSTDETFNAWQLATAALGYATWGETEQAHAWVGPYSLAAVRAFLSGEALADLASRLREVAAPTLVIAGAQDARAGAAPVVAVADRRGRRQLGAGGRVLLVITSPTSSGNLFDLHRGLASSGCQVRRPRVQDGVALPRTARKARVPLHTGDGTVLGLGMPRQLAPWVTGGDLTVVVLQRM